MPDIAPLRAGDPAQVAGYRLTGRIGAGGQGVVYLGVSPDDEDERVAVKVLRVEDDHSRALFTREVAAARRVAPFCTAQIISFETDGPSPYVISEFIDGPSLQQYVAERGPLTGTRLQRLAIGTSTALAAIHQVGVVHRDLKPANVMMSPEGPRVIDFGIARDLAQDTTKVSKLFGTPAYMSPEQLRAEKVGPATDMFAWGSVMAFAATGRAPFESNHIMAAINKIANEEPDLTGIPPELLTVLRHCFSKDPARRPTAQQTLYMLLGRPSELDTPNATIVLAEATQLVEASSTGPTVGYTSAHPDAHLTAVHQPAPMGETRVDASMMDAPGLPATPVTGPGGPVGKGRSTAASAAGAAAAPVPGSGSGSDSAVGHLPPWGTYAPNTPEQPQYGQPQHSRAMYVQPSQGAPGPQGQVQQGQVQQGPVKQGQAPQQGQTPQSGQASRPGRTSRPGQPLQPSEGAPPNYGTPPDRGVSPSSQGTSPSYGAPSNRGPVPPNRSTSPVSQGFSSGQGTTSGDGTGASHGTGSGHGTAPGHGTGPNHGVSPSHGAAPGYGAPSNRGGASSNQGTATPSRQGASPNHGTAPTYGASSNHGTPPSNHGTPPPNFGTPSPDYGVLPMYGGPSSSVPGPAQRAGGAAVPQPSNGPGWNGPQPQQPQSQPQPQAWGAGNSGVPVPRQKAPNRGRTVVLATAAAVLIVAASIVVWDRALDNDVSQGGSSSSSSGSGSKGAPDPAACGGRINVGADSDCATGSSESKGASSADDSNGGTNKVAASGTLPYGLDGTWEGTVSQPLGKVSNFTVRMELTGGRKRAGTMNMPELGCLANLTVENSGLTTAKLNAPVKAADDPNNACARKAEVILIGTSDDTISYTWTDKTAIGNTASGTLTRVD